MIERIKKFFDDWHKKMLAEIISDGRPGGDTEYSTEKFQDLKLRKSVGNGITEVYTVKVSGIKGDWNNIEIKGNVIKREYEGNSD